VSALESDPPARTERALTPARRYYKGSSDGKRPLRFDPLARVRPRYDVIVIGSGLAGLTAANVLARNGHTVCVLEQHYNYGGLATWFKRPGGHVFDVSLHGFPVGMKKTCRKYWNAEIAARIVRLDSVRFVNPQFDCATEFTRTDFTHKLVEVFGLARAAVEGFFDHLRRMEFTDASNETTGELFERFFPGQNHVHRLLLEPISYANGSGLDDPAKSFGIVFSNFMSEGVFTFSGGTDGLIAAMRAELARNGVELYNHAEVERIVLEDGRACGVVVNGKHLAARAVLSNASIKATLERLVGLENLSPRFAEAARAVRLSSSSCQVFFGLARGTRLPFIGDLVFHSTRARFDSEALCDFHGESRTFSVYYPKGRPGSDRHAIVSSTNARFADWAALDAAAYVREKERLARDTLTCLEGFLPGIGAAIEHQEVATPRTFAFYTQAPLGSSFGTKFEGLRVSLDLAREVAGLFHAGSVGIIMSGWLGAANYGVIQANKVDAYLLATREPVGATR
jgi:phytoene dehydrogenase-like protein